MLSIDISRVFSVWHLRNPSRHNLLRKGVEMTDNKRNGDDGGQHRHRHTHPHGVKREDTHGAKSMHTLSRISQHKQDEEVKQSLEFGLEAADSVIDRNISLFSRGHQPAFAGINTFRVRPAQYPKMRVTAHSAELSSPFHGTRTR